MVIGALSCCPPEQISSELLWMRLRKVMVIGALRCCPPEQISSSCYGCGSGVDGDRCLCGGAVLLSRLLRAAMDVAQEVDPDLNPHLVSSLARRR